MFRAARATGRETTLSVHDHLVNPPDTMDAEYPMSHDETDHLSSASALHTEGSSPPPLPPPAPDARSVRRLNRGWPVHWISWVFAIAAIAPGPLALALTVLRTSEAEPIGRVGGSIVVTCLWIGLFYLLAWGAYALCRRSKIAANVTFCVLCTLLLALFFSSLGRASDLKRRQDARSELLPRLTEQWRSRQAAYSNQAQALVKDGGLSPATLHSLDEIETRLAAMRELAAANASLGDYLLGMTQRTIDAFKAEGFSERAARQEASRFMAAWPMDVLVQIRDSEAQSCAGFIALLELLRDEWGRWEYDQAQDMTLFETDEAVERFNLIHAQLEEAAAQQQRAIAELGERR